MHGLAYLREPTYSRYNLTNGTKRVEDEHYEFLGYFGYMSYDEEIGLIDEHTKSTTKLRTYYTVYVAGHI